MTVTNRKAFWNALFSEMKASLRRIPTVEPREIQLRSSECYRFSKYPFKKKSPYLLSLSSNMEVLFSSKVCDEEHEPWSWANCSFECSCASNQWPFWQVKFSCNDSCLTIVVWGRWEEGSGWGTHVHPWWIHVDVWQNQYNIVKQLASN